MKLRVAWWNTKLHGVTSPDDERARFVAGIVERLVRDAGCDVVALCEVPPSLAASVCPASADVHHDASVGVRPHSIALLVRKDVVRATPRGDYRERRTRTEHHAGVRFELDAFDAPTLWLTLCHWAAIGMGDQDHVCTSHAQVAETIRRVADEGVASVVDHVVIGDFNEEPFDKAMRDDLLTSRDLERVRDDDRGMIFYNIAWRWLSRQAPFRGASERAVAAGTHYFRSGVENRWRTYDQALVSASLLRGRGWTLREDESEIWFDDSLRGSKGGVLRGGIDHLPILVTLEYIQADEET